MIPERERYPSTLAELGGAQEVKPESPLESAMREVQISAKQVSEVVNQLRKRLNVVLRPETPTPDKNRGGETLTQPPSPFEGELRKVAATNRHNHAEILRMLELLTL